MPYATCALICQTDHPVPTLFTFVLANFTQRGAEISLPAPTHRPRSVIASKAIVQHTRRVSDLSPRHRTTSTFSVIRDFHRREN